MNSIFHQVSTQIKSKLDSLDTEIASAYVKQRQADAARVADIDSNRQEEREQKANFILDNKTSALDDLAEYKLETTDELAQLIGVSTDEGSLSAETAFQIINYLGTANEGWINYQSNQHGTAMQALSDYEALIGTTESFTGAVIFESASNVAE